MRGHGKGCHKCGGYPGSPKRNRAYLSVCVQCKTYSCNEHLTLTGACLRCGGRTEKVLTQTDLYHKGSADLNGDDFGNSSGTSSFGATSGGGTFGGGLNLPKKSSPQAQISQVELTEIHSEKAISKLAQQLLVETNNATHSINNTNTVHTHEGLSFQKEGEEEVKPPLALNTPTLQAPTYHELDDLFDDGPKPAPTLAKTPFKIEETAEGPSNPLEETKLEPNIEDDDQEERDAIEKAFATLVWEDRLPVENPSIKWLKEAAVDKRAVTPLEEHQFVDCFWQFTEHPLLEKSVTAYTQSLPKQQKDLRFGLVSFTPEVEEGALNGPLSAIEKTENIFYAAGFQERYKGNLNNEKLLFLIKKNIVLNNKIIAIGELGIDLHYTPYSAQNQKSLLLAQLQIALEKGFPVFLQQKKALPELEEVLHICAKASQKPLRVVYTGLLESDDLLTCLLRYDAHILLRPELTYDMNAQALERTATMPSVRWLLGAGGAVSVPKGSVETYNTLRNTPLKLAPFFAKALGRPHKEDLLGLCAGNWARFLLGTPLKKESERIKEDLWAEFR